MLRSSLKVLSKSPSWCRFLISSLLFSLALAGSACDAGRSTSDPRARSRTRPSEPPPLETEVLEEEEVRPVQESEAKSGLETSSFRACGWSRRWSQRQATKPVLPGPSVPAPKKVSGDAPRLPARDGVPAGAPVLQVVIDEEGRVEEVNFIQTFSPAWPAGEQAIAEAVQKWRYTPSTLKDRPVPVCITITVSL